MELSDRHSVFIGFKLDGSLRRQLQSLSGPDSKYVSREESSFLRLCQRGDDVYVGKVVEDGLPTDRVEDVKRNVLSILRRLCPDVRLPVEMEILVCLPDEPRPEIALDKEKPSFEGFS